MKTILTRLLRVPESNDSKTVTVGDAWAVRWTARNGDFYTDTFQVAEFFLSEGEARDFAESIRNAFLLLKHTGKGTKITVSKSDTE